GAASVRDAARLRVDPRAKDDRGHRGAARIRHLKADEIGEAAGLGPPRQPALAAVEVPEPQAVGAVDDGHAVLGVLRATPVEVHLRGPEWHPAADEHSAAVALPDGIAEEV